MSILQPKPSLKLQYMLLDDKPEGRVRGKCRKIRRFVYRVIVYSLRLCNVKQIALFLNVIHHYEFRTCKTSPWWFNRIPRTCQFFVYLVGRTPLA